MINLVQATSSPRTLPKSVQGSHNLATEHELSRQPLPTARSSRDQLGKREDEDGYGLYMLLEGLMRIHM